MTDGMNAEVILEIYGIEVDDEDVRDLRDGKLTREEMMDIVYDAIDGNYMELKIVKVKLSEM